MAEDRRPLEMPEFPVEFAEEERDILRGLETEAERLRGIYHQHYTGKAWEAKPLPERIARRIVDPLHRVPLAGRFMPELTPERFEARRLELEDEIRGLSRREYVHDRIPQILDEMRTLAIHEPATIEGFRDRADVTRRWKDTDEWFTDEEIAYLVRHALALAQATPEERLTGEYWDKVAPKSDVDYSEYFLDPKLLKPEQIMSSVALSQDVEVIREALQMAYPPPKPEDIPVDYKKEELKAEAEAYGVEYDEENLDKTITDLEEVKYFLDGIPVRFNVEDLGEDVELHISPTTENMPFPLVWYIDPETGEEEFLGYYSEKERAWLPFSLGTGEILYTDEEQEEITFAQHLWGTAQMVSSSMWQGIKMAPGALVTTFLDFFRDPEPTPEQQRRAEEILGIEEAEARVEAWEQSWRGRFFEWRNEKLDDGMEALAERAEHQMEQYFQFLADADIKLIAEYRRPPSQVREEDGWIGLLEPRWFLTNVIEIVPSATIMAGSIAITTKLTKNPKLGMAIGAAIIGPAEASRVYVELMEAGIPHEEAAKWMTILIPILGGLEVAGGGILLRAVAPGLWNQILHREVTKQLIKLTLGQKVKHGLKMATQTQLAEWAIEMSVQAVGNAVLAHEDVYESWYQGLDDAAIKIWLGFLPMSAFGGGTHTMHLSRYMREAGLEAQVHERATELQQAGLSESDAQVRAYIEILETPEGQVVRDRVETEGRKLIEAEMESPQIVRDVLHTEEAITATKETVKNLDTHVRRLRESINRREATVARTVDVTLKQRRQQTVDSLKQQMETLETQRTEQRNKLEALYDQSLRQGREAQRQGVVTERIWNTLTPEARAVHAKEVGLTSDTVAKVWNEMTVNEQAALLRDVKPAPPIEQIVTLNDTIYNKMKLERQLQVINEQITEIDTRLEGEARAKERLADLPADFRQARLQQIEAEFAQAHQERADLIEQRDAIQEKFAEVDRAIEKPAGVTEESLDANTFRQAEHPTNEYGFARQPSFEAQQATVDNAMAENPDIAKTIRAKRDITQIPARSLNWAKIAAPPIFRKYIWGLYDTKHIFMNLQMATGMPFYRLFNMIRRVNSAITKSVKFHIEKITKDKELTRLAQNEESLRRVEQVLDSRRTGEKLAFIPTDAELRFADTVAAIFRHYEPYIRVLKLEHAVEEFGYDVDAILKDIFPDATAQEANRADIEHAVNLMRRGETQAVFDFLAPLDWGVIQGYTPWMMVDPQLGVPHRGRLSARGEARLLHRKGFEMPSMDKTIMQRLQSYINQVEAQWQLKSEIRTLRDMLDTVKPKMDNATAMYENMNSFLHELQHMPPEGIHHPGMVTMMRLYRSMAAAVFVYPLLLTRNFLQAGVFHPYRRWLLRSMKALPVDLQNKARIMFNEEASQFKGIMESQVFHGVKPLLADIPGIGKPYHSFVRLLDRLSLYAKTDVIPRHRSFNAGVIRAYEAIQAYRKHKDINRLVRESGVEHLRTEQQTHFKELVAIGDKVINLGLEGLQEVTGYEAAMLYNGTEVADLTHFNYERWMRPQLEHGMHGRLIFNLLTFTRSYWTRHYFNLQKVTDTTLSTHERLTAFKDTLSLIAVGALASAYLDELAGRNYRSYWIGEIMWWQLGGLMVGGVNEMVLTMQDLHTSLDSDTEEGDKRKAISSLFRRIRRNAGILVPFMRNAIALFESVTGLGEIDKRIANEIKERLFKEWTAEEIDKLELSFMEAFTKVLFDTPPPDLMKVEEAQEIMAQKRDEIGTIDPGTGYHYSIGNYGRDIAAYLKKIPADMISVNNGFTELDEFYVDFWYRLKEFEELPTIGKARDNYRKANPEFEAMLIFWERFERAVFRRGSKEAEQIIELLKIWDTIYEINPAVSRARLVRYEQAQLKFRED